MSLNHFKNLKNKNPCGCTGPALVNIIFDTNVFTISLSKINGLNSPMIRHYYQYIPNIWTVFHNTKGRTIIQVFFFSLTKRLG